MSSSFLAYQAIMACLRQREIGERYIREGDVGERNIRERDIEETVATCRFNQQLLIHIHIQGISR
jgi:hypothetical protein